MTFARAPGARGPVAAAKAPSGPKAAVAAGASPGAGAAVAGASPGAGAVAAGASPRAGAVGAGAAPASSAQSSGPNASPAAGPAGAASAEPGAALAPTEGPGAGAAAGAGEPREEERQAADKRLEEAQARAAEPLDPKARADALRQTALPSVAGRPVRGYAQRGIVELGGGVSFVNATNFMSFGFAPTAGWFFIDNVSLTLIPQLNYVKAGGEGPKLSAVVLIEPGFHMQMSGPLFAFFGAGVGVAYERDVGVGMALSPRAGLKVLVGGSGVLTTVFEYVYSANQKPEEPTADDPNSATYGLRAGYSVAW